jgi:DUF4097 and DUF4098 domain-containing protein YvlB
VDRSFTSVSAIDLRLGSARNVVIKDGSTVSVKGQLPLSYGGLKAELDDDGVLTVTNSRDRKSSGFFIHIAGIFGDRAYASSFVEITVPRGASLSAIATDIGYGDAKTENVAADSISVKSASGNIYANGLTCDSFNIDSSYGDIDVLGVDTGDADFTSASGDISITDMTAPRRLTVESSYGGLKITNVDTGDAAFSSGSGDIDMTSLTASGGLTVASSYGDVNLTAVKAEVSEINLKSGNFVADIFSVAGGMNLHSSFGDVVIGGDLRGDSVIEVASGSLDLTFDGAEDDYLVAIESESGDVAVGDKSYGGAYFERGAQSAPNHIKAQSGFGDVKVRFRG